MEKNNGVDIVLISRYLNRETDESESLKVEKWIKDSPENAVEFDKLKKSWELAAAGFGQEYWNSFNKKDLLLLKIIKAQASGKNGKRVSLIFSDKFLKSGLRYAAILVLMISITVLLINYLSNNKNNVENQLKYTQISAPAGTKTIIYLVDGTKVWLNAESTVKFNAGFNNQNRNIILLGEAYFEVAQNKNLPFIVNAGEIEVEAVGTVFNVKAYPLEKVIETTLVEGSVVVFVDSLPQNKISLMPNEQLSYYKPDHQQNLNSKMLKTKGVEVKTFTGWINDRLHINSESLESLAIKLERKYNVKIYFEDKSLQKLQFTGILENETIEQIMEIIRISSSIQYRIDGREIWLIKKK